MQNPTISSVPPVLVLHDGGLQHSAAPVFPSSSLVDKKVSCTPETDAEETSTDTNINKLNWFTGNCFGNQMPLQYICPPRTGHRRDF